MMLIEIKHRYTNNVLFACEAENMRAAVILALGKVANLRGVDLTGANLRGANLRNTDLRGIDLTDANLREADLTGSDLRNAVLTNIDLTGANLRGANLRGIDLTDANLRGVDLTAANLTGVDLRGANLRGADLRGADLRGANLRNTDLTAANLTGVDLRGANLRDVDLQIFKTDFFDTLLRAPKEIDGLHNALVEGRVNGLLYEGVCACLKGTIANVRQCHYEELGAGMVFSASLPAEQWFTMIKEGDTPENNQASRLSVEWIDEFKLLLEAAK